MVIFHGYVKEPDGSFESLHSSKGEISS
jgi:hypothetical protein